MKKLLLIGGTGQIGTALRSACEGQLASPLRGEFDLVTGDLDTLLTAHTPEVVVNCAAFHNVDRCEREFEPAFETNAIAVGRLAEACARRDILFVTLSTDYVFAGDAGHPYKEDDRAEPLTVYGISKLAGELLARRYVSTTIIVRTSGVFGTVGTSGKGYTLIDRVLSQAERGEPTQMVADITFSPSYAPDVARAILDVVERAALGIHHITNAGACTWYEFVRFAFESAGLGDASLSPVTYASLGNATPRPLQSPLENTTFSALGISPLPPWQKALRRFLRARTERQNAGS